MKKVIIILSAVAALIAGCFIGYSLIDRRNSRRREADLLDD